MMIFILSILSGLLCYRLGWVAAHKTVAVECERLGGFYVNDKVFKCYQIDSRRYTPPAKDSAGPNALPKNIPRPAPPLKPAAREGRHL